MKENKNMYAIEYFNKQGITRTIKVVDTIKEARQVVKEQSELHDFLTVINWNNGMMWVYRNGKLNYKQQCD